MHAAASRRALREVRVEKRQGGPRLPRHDRLHALLGAPRAHRAAGGREALGLEGHRPRRRRGGRRAQEAARPQGSVLHRGRPHAGEPQADGLALVAGKVRVVGEEDRARDGTRHIETARQQADRGAGLRPLPQRARALQVVFARAARAGLRHVQRRLGRPELHGVQELHPLPQGGRRQGALGVPCRGRRARRPCRPREVGGPHARRRRLQKRR